MCSRSITTDNCWPLNQKEYRQDSNLFQLVYYMITWLLTNILFWYTIPISSPNIKHFNILIRYFVVSRRYQSVQPLCNGQNDQRIGVQFLLRTDFSSPLCPYRLWVPLNLLSSRYRALFPRDKAVRMWS